ncbi:cyanidin 3-O-rutinoside 5-O-glucosyltransferase-like [Phalaenopsis equestris]|uniref:cyanidin 3-O-rutinoside 5-O-glucosyltransferase-like n=1 Tax=Phalaenopsis equestris TaxID=78828 RepID=UPI0009E415AE|nr:cyanidin 3-O-rutinoside 5-O-glucosyltransferase-like [Phalaenopsis equestris]
MDHQPPSPTTKPHILIITFPAQGHLNPAINLAKRLLSSTNSDITFCTATTAHCRMFPSLPSPASPILHNGITYIPFSDGFSSLQNANDTDLRSLVSQVRELGSSHLTTILQDLASSGRPVTCLIYTIMVQWAGDVATELRIHSALYWIQAATILSIYHHFFNGYESFIVSHAKDPSFPISFPSLPTFQIRDLPNFLTITSPDDPFFDILNAFRKLFTDLSLRRQAGEKPRVLVNSFDELEMNALAPMEEHMELITVGPAVLNEAEGETEDMFEEDEEEYMEWLDSQEDKSVVYVAFGSVHKMSKEEIEEIGKGLKESQRPYLWVIGKDRRWHDMNIVGEVKQGMVLKWCKQGRVLRHKAVGCFVTHCGWNSTLEGLLYGVPAVAMPKWSDQATNAWLMERQWGMGLKAEVGEKGWVLSEELRRCLDIVMGEGERGVEMRMKAEMWKEKARKAISEGGSSEKNLMAFGCQRNKH